MRAVRSVLAITALGALVLAGLAQPAVAAPAFTGGEGQFTPVIPSRILDTRSAVGASGPVRAGHPVTVQVGGRGGVPATGVSAVVLTVTMTSATQTSTATVYPTGSSQPTGSSVAVAKGRTASNLVTVQLDPSGRVTVSVSAGSAQVMGDVAGWFADNTAPSTTGGELQLTRPQRLTDTRGASPLFGRQTLTTPVDYSTMALDPNSDITALVVNIMVSGAQYGGHLTTWSGVGSAPGTGSVYFASGQTVSGLAVVPVGPCIRCTGGSHDLPSIAVKNNSDGVADVVVDIVGFFDNGSLAGGLRFAPKTSPVRILNTASAGSSTSPFGPGKTKTVVAPSPAADDDTVVLVQNVVASATSSTYLLLWPTGGTRPSVSTTHPRARVKLASLAFTPVGAANDINIYNDAGTTNVALDVVGTFEQN
jgi:hypothetical protein